LEQISGKPRRLPTQSRGPAAQAILNLKPLAYWRLDETEAPIAADASGNQRHAVYDPGTLFFLEGPHAQAYCGDGQTNRCVHLAGGRLRSRLDTLPQTYSVTLWFWNGMPSNARPVTGWLFSRDHAHAISNSGQHLGLGGTASEPGKVIFQDGNGSPLVGKAAVDRWGWNHLVLVQTPDHVQVYLNGELEIEAKASPHHNVSIPTCFVGGRSDNQSNWEGRIDEVAIFDRALSEDEVKSLIAQ
ncbi:MAG: LamG domain-containing protein, partial [Pirellulales bacterium]|nr:LamG domain-containing protein [Pirellulales bacterium]